MLTLLDWHPSLAGIFSALWHIVAEIPTTSSDIFDICQSKILNFLTNRENYFREIEFLKSICFHKFFGYELFEIFWLPAITGVEAVGLPKVSSGIVQPIDLIHFHYEKSNNDLELLMRKDMENEEETTPKKLEVEKFLRKHVENRLRMNIPYLHQWPNALGNIHNDFFSILCMKLI